MTGWFVRLVHRWLGIDAVNYWRERHGGTLELLGQLKDTANKAIADAEATIRMQIDEMNKLRARTVKAEGELSVERNVRALLQQLVTEIGEQAARNKDVAPATLLGVIDVATHEAVRTVEQALLTGQADVAEIVNIRATMANRLLPDAKQPTLDRAGNRPAIVTERKRDGKAGDSASPPNPKLPHTYEYDPYGKATSLNHEGHLCNVEGCGKPLAHAIHQKSTGWGSEPTGIRMEAEKRPEDGPPQTLISMHEFKAEMVSYEDQDEAGEFCEVCQRPKGDPIHYATGGIV